MNPDQQAVRNRRQVILRQVTPALVSFFRQLDFKDPGRRCIPCRSRAAGRWQAGGDLPRKPAKGDGNLLRGTLLENREGHFTANLKVGDLYCQVLGGVQLLSMEGNDPVSRLKPGCFCRATLVEMTNGDRLAVPHRQDAQERKLIGYQLVSQGCFQGN